MNVFNPATTVWILQTFTRGEQGSLGSHTHLMALITAFSGAERSSTVTSQWQPFSSKASSGPRFVSAVREKERKGENLNHSKQKHFYNGSSKRLKTKLGWKVEKAQGRSIQLWIKTAFKANLSLDPHHWPQATPLSFTAYILRGSTAVLKGNKMTFHSPKNKTNKYDKNINLKQNKKKKKHPHFECRFWKFC